MGLEDPRTGHKTLASPVINEKPAVTGNCTLL